MLFLFNSRTVMFSEILIPVHYNSLQRGGSHWRGFYSGTFLQSSPWKSEFIKGHKYAVSSLMRKKNWSGPKGMADCYAEKLNNFSRSWRHVLRYLWCFCQSWAANKMSCLLNSSVLKGEWCWQLADGRVEKKWKGIETK